MGVEHYILKMKNTNKLSGDILIITSCTCTINTVIQRLMLLCRLEVLAHYNNNVLMWWSYFFHLWSFTWYFLHLLVSPMVSLRHSIIFSHQWQLQHNWPAASLEQIGLVLYSILTQKSSTLRNLLSRKMDDPSPTPLPSPSPLSSHWLRNRPYLVSESWWGEHFVQAQGTINHCSP